MMACCFLFDQFGDKPQVTSFTGFNETKTAKMISVGPANNSQPAVATVQLELAKRSDHTSEILQ